MCRSKVKRIVNPWLIDAENNSTSAALNICGTNSIQLFISVRLSIDSCSNVFNKILHLLGETEGAGGQI